MKKMRFFHSAEKGAHVVIFAAADAGLTGVTGPFLTNSKPRKFKPITHDQEADARLWTISERLTSSSTTTPG